MRLGKLSLSVFATVALLFGLAAEALAVGGAESCVIDSRSQLPGRPKITGSAVVELFNFTLGGVGAFADRADATLTLTHEHNTVVFRATIAPAFTGLLVVSAEQVMCDIFDANPTATVPVDGGTELRTIFQVFGFPTPLKPTDSLKLCLVPEKKSPEDLACQSIRDLDFHPIPGTPDWTGSMKLVIYVFE
jgi:hypothetical protein